MGTSVPIPPETAALQGADCHLYPVPGREARFSCHQRTTPTQVTARRYTHRSFRYTLFFCATGAMPTPPSGTEVTLQRPNGRYRSGFRGKEYHWTSIPGNPLNLREHRHFDGNFLQDTGVRNFFCGL
ncbi:hypothetical protein TGP89_232955 [Toxoplasma gondii p89]|uniref:Uncharacterized protein n=1 Tax=Toxoplasma gondii p89 TaxID=943119 RepID=A0A086L3N6_TOXGO|nr:hypothetical protein TGP89_232955 [Toxoplasma gondii p89]